MYKPPFTSFKQPKADPMQPPAARVSQKAAPGSKTYDCPVIKKEGNAPFKPAPRIQLVDPRKVREQASNVDRRKEIVDTPMATMSNANDKENQEFQKTAEEAKMAVFWVFPEECTSVYMNKISGIAYPNVCLIGINGKQWPLFPGNNRAPGFVYEALEDHRELARRYKQKIAPPKASGRSVMFTDPRSTVSGKIGGGRINSNQDIFTDSLLGRPNSYDTSRDFQASEMVRRAKEKFLKSDR